MVLHPLPRPLFRNDRSCSHLNTSVAELSITSTNSILHVHRCRRGSPAGRPARIVTRAHRHVIAHTTLFTDTSQIPSIGTDDLVSRDDALFSLARSLTHSRRILYMYSFTNTSIFYLVVFFPEITMGHGI